MPRSNLHADDLVRIRHMIDAAEAAETFVSGRSRQDLDGDRMLLFALVRAIEVLGEAAAKVSVETRASAPDVPWAAITGMRNRLVHGYFDIDANIVWKTVTVELPQLVRRLRALTPEHGAS